MSSSVVTVDRFCTHLESPGPPASQEVQKAMPFLGQLVPFALNAAETGALVKHGDKHGGFGVP